MVDALGHRPHAVRALRCHVGAKAELAEQIEAVGLGGLLRGLAGVERHHQRDEATDDERIAEAVEDEALPPIGPLHPGVDPDLALAAVDAVRVGPLRLGHRRQGAAELDEVLEPHVVVLDDLEIVDDGVDRGKHARPDPR